MMISKRPFSHILIAGISFAFAPSCKAEEFQGYINIANQIYISEEHRREDRQLTSGEVLRIVELSYINSWVAGDTSERFDIQFRCTSGEFRILGGAEYSERDLKGSAKPLSEESIFAMRLPPSGSGAAKVIEYARKSEAICLRP